MEFVHRPYIPEETVAAIATPPGEGGIAIVRISGADSFQIAKEIFSKSPEGVPSHTVLFGKVLSRAGLVIDEALLLLMRGPRSFTGEDTVEIHCHGGSLVTRKVLERVLEAGARLASPGQFTLKAFMNGKIDLTKAEAIERVIGAKNEMAYRAAEKQLEGALSRKIRDLQHKLFDVAAILEASVDFPEESLEFASTEEVLSLLENIRSSMQALSDGFSDGKKIHEGLSLCLTGPPNAGKSSLMNALLGKDRAIVTDIPGTTRDLLEEDLRLGGLHFKLVDTAGIRETTETVEIEGIKKSKEAIASADLVVLVLDGSIPVQEKMLEPFLSLPKEKTVVVFNKIDLGRNQRGCLPGFRETALSAKTGEGMAELKQTIESIVWDLGPPDTGEVIVTHLRHKEALDAAISFLSPVIEGLRSGVSPEFLSFDMRKCLFELGSIIGVNISEEILGSIFSKFCIGK